MQLIRFEIAQSFEGSSRIGNIQDCFFEWAEIVAFSVQDPGNDSNEFKLNAIANQDFSCLLTERGGVDRGYSCVQAQKRSGTSHQTIRHRGGLQILLMFLDGLNEASDSVI